MNKIVFDFSSIKLNEAVFYNKFSDLVQKCLKKLFGYDIPPIRLKGNPADIRAFVQAIKKEKQYMELFSSIGPEHAEVVRAKAEMKNAVRDFEQRTGLRWPFKD